MKEQNIESVPEFRFTAGAGRIWDALAALERTGWVMRGVPEPETVADHTRSLCALAREVAPDLELSSEELDDLLAILEVHDWPEALVGDLVVFGDEPNAVALKQAKKKAESEAIIELTKELPKGEQVRMLYERYETGADRIASLAKQLDKLQAVLQARQYEERYGLTGTTREFFEYSKKYITEPALLQRLHAALGGL